MQRNKHWDCLALGISLLVLVHSFRLIEVHVGVSVICAVVILVLEARVVWSTGSRRHRLPFFYKTSQHTSANMLPIS